MDENGEEQEMDVEVGVCMLIKAMCHTISVISFKEEQDEPEQAEVEPSAPVTSVTNKESAGEAPAAR